MQPVDIIAFWGKGILKRWPENSLKDVEIPMSSKLFLMEVGLPVQQNWTLRFNPQIEPLPHIPKRHHYRQIGFDDVVPICLDEHHLGRIVAVEQKVGGEDRYINLNVECFGECLVYYQQYRTVAPSLSELEVEQVIASTESLIRNADTTAFEDPNNWWPVIVEQMRQGLL